MHVEDPEHPEATTASMVAELPLVGPPIVHALVGSPCRATYQRLEVSGGLGAHDVVLLG